jgi:hypothetical protein
MELKLGSIWHTVAREEALRLADEGEFQVFDVFNVIRWKIGFVGMAADEAFLYAQLAVEELLKAREVETVPEYTGQIDGKPAPWIYRRASVLDRIVGAIENDDT